jgi:hypothetical protein
MQTATIATTGLDGLDDGATSTHKPLFGAERQQEALAEPTRPAAGFLLRHGDDLDRRSTADLDALLAEC